MPHRLARTAVSFAPSALGPIACIALAAACSGYYPVGDAGQGLLAPDEAGGGLPAGDARVAPALAAPEVTVGLNLDWMPDDVAALGDVDGDGHDDFAIASSDSDTGVAFVQLYYGVPRSDDPESLFAFGEGDARLTLSADGFTPSVLPAGDIDGDGHADILVQTPSCDVTLPDGGAYLVYGDPEPLTGTRPLASVAARFSFPPRAGQAEPAAGPVGCLALATPRAPGDLDGDGFDDLVIDAQLERATADGSRDGVPLDALDVFYGRAERFSGEVAAASADARLRARAQLAAFAAGDVNADGLADLLVEEHGAGGTFVLAGRSARWSGTLDIASSATLIAGARAQWSPGYQLAGDLDADGVSDLLLAGPGQVMHVFYGGPGAFAAGADLSGADASVAPTEQTSHIYLAGDRDGDGDDELLDLFTLDAASSPLGRSVAFSSGSRRRLSGTLAFPEGEVAAQTPVGRFPGDPGRVLVQAFPAGDLDGDGAVEIVSFSQQRHPGGALIVPQLHVHYGTPATSGSRLR